MSRIASFPVALPAGVEVTIGTGELRVKGKKGEMTCPLHAEVAVTQEDKELKFAARSRSQAAKAAAGTTRALVQNMVTGVTEGFERKLDIVGVGYRAQVQGKSLNLTVGLSHPVRLEIPDGVTIETPSQTEIVVKGVDKQLVGQLAANIRAYRPPEPYKGKGVRYSDERIIRKEAKKA